jgi:hypothetical protein
MNIKKYLQELSGRVKDFSIERLFSFLDSLDQHIEIKITQKSKVKTEPSINIAYG